MSARVRVRRRRLTWLAVTLGFVAGVVVRSELQRRLNAGRRLLPGDPHRYAPDPRWPGSCWCAKPEGAPPHPARGAVR